MKNYIITYDLNKEGQDYTTLINIIKTYYHKHPLYSVWFIKSDKTSAEITNELLKYIDQNDRLFVSEITNNRNWFLEQEYWDFLNS